MSFQGTFEGKVDGQGRIIIPLRFRVALQEGMVLTTGLESCITVYTPDEWEGVLAKVRQLDMFDRNARDISRHFISGAFPSKADGQGRVVVPPRLRTYASLEDEIVIAGNDNYLEIWSAKLWEEQKVKAGNPADLADRLAKRS